MYRAWRLIIASNPLQANTSNNKSPTIVTPIITVRLDGAGEQAYTAPPDEAALWSPSLAGSYEGIASAKPPLVKENTIQLPKSKSLIHQGALETAKDDQKAAGQEAASAQVVKRGHQVTFIEVPDDKDITSFMMNRSAKLTPPLETAVTSPTVVEPLWVDTKAKEAPHEWLKPFRAEWTLCGIVEARTESEAKAILKNWIHKAHMEEVVDEMIEGMRKAERVNVLWWLKELQQPKQYISALSGKGKDLVIPIEVETLTNIT